MKSPTLLEQALQRERGSIPKRAALNFG